MGFIRELGRLLGPVFLFSLGFLAARRAGDQTKNTYTKCVLAGAHDYGMSRVTFRFHASDGSGDMKPGVRELTALFLLSGFCCGLAWAHADTFFVAVFGAATALTIIEVIRRLG